MMRFDVVSQDNTNYIFATFMCMCCILQDPTVALSGLNDVQNEQDITVNDVSSLSCNFYDYTLILNNL